MIPNVFIRNSMVILLALLLGCGVATGQGRDLEICPGSSDAALIAFVDEVVHIELTGDRLAEQLGELSGGPFYLRVIPDAVTREPGWDEVFVAGTFSIGRPDPAPTLDDDGKSIPCRFSVPVFFDAGVRVGRESFQDTAARREEYIVEEKDGRLLLGLPLPPPTIASVAWERFAGRPPYADPALSRVAEHLR